MAYLVNCAVNAQVLELNRPLVEEPAPRANLPLAGLRVLLVEDEMLVLMEAEDMLFAMGCRSVITAATVQQAVDRIGSNSLDAALLDLNLGGDRSYAVADALSAREVPFIFATGYGAGGLRASDKGHVVLTKPYGYQQLSKAMRALLQH